jgi:EAL domain-containing protein (putative c-di-GMP-specific phosphodiesterase class I)
MKQANNYQVFLLDKQRTYQDPMPFFMQPIMSVADGLVFGFEILFRGGTPSDWSVIDKSVVNHLCDSPADTLPTMFVNICGKAFLDISHEQFIDAAKKNKIYFEMSESLADDPDFQTITSKIDALSANGVLFAFDDFGRNRGGLPRVFALDDISFIKVDGDFIRSAMAGKNEEQALRCLIDQWRNAKIQSIAEWIETPEMLEFAKQVNFDFVQGFHIDAMLNGLDSTGLYLA